jgi:hypothetical protein
MEVFSLDDTRGDSVPVPKAISSASANNNALPAQYLTRKQIDILIPGAEYMNPVMSV